MNLSQIKQLLLNNLWFGEQGSIRKRSTIISELINPDINKIWGIDISHWNVPPVDLKNMATNFGMKFVGIKGCDGSLNSKYYLNHVAAADATGIPYIMYVWLYPNSKVSIDAQVNAWVARAEATNPALVAIDAEWTKYLGIAANPSADDLRMAHDKFAHEYGQAAITYTAASYANQYLIGFDWHREKLWIAHYGVTTPLLPKNASEYLIHQYTSTLDGKALDPNGNFELDGNNFNGDTATFNRIFGVQNVPPEEHMLFGKITGPANLRNGPGGAYPAFGITPFLQINDLVESDVQTLAWWRIIKIARGGVNVPLPGPECWAWVGNITETVPPTPTNDTVLSVQFHFTENMITAVTVDGVDWKPV